MRDDRRTTERHRSLRHALLRGLALALLSGGVVGAARAQGEAVPATVPIRWSDASFDTALAEAVAAGCPGLRAFHAEVLAELSRIVENSATNRDLGARLTRMGRRMESLGVLGEGQAPTPDAVPLSIWKATKDALFARYMALRGRQSAEHPHSFSYGLWIDKLGWYVGRVEEHLRRGCADADTAPSVEIVAPQGGRFRRSDLPLGLIGVVRDAEDGELPADSVSWSSNIQGELGHGTTATVETPRPGEHEITLTARDSSGRTATDTVTVEVVSAGRSACLEAAERAGLGTDPEPGRWFARLLDRRGLARRTDHHLVLGGARFRVLLAGPPSRRVWDRHESLRQLDEQHAALVAQHEWIEERVATITHGAAPDRSGGLEAIAAWLNACWQAGEPGDQIQLNALVAEAERQAVELHTGLEQYDRMRGPVVAAATAAEDAASRRAEAGAEADSCAEGQSLTEDLPSGAYLFWPLTQDVGDFGIQDDILGVVLEYLLDASSGVVQGLAGRLAGAADGANQMVRAYPVMLVVTWECRDGRYRRASVVQRLGAAQEEKHRLLTRSREMNISWLLRWTREENAKLEQAIAALPEIRE